MDGQRVQEYLQLIQKLRNCPVGKELEVLQHHQNLIDLGFVQVMRQVANTLRQQGQEDEANLLDCNANGLCCMNRWKTKHPDRGVLSYGSIG